MNKNIICVRKLPIKNVFVTYTHLIGRHDYNRYESHTLNTSKREYKLTFTSFDQMLLHVSNINNTSNYLTTCLVLIR